MGTVEGVWARDDPMARKKSPVLKEAIDKSAEPNPKLIKRLDDAGVAESGMTPLRYLLHVINAQRAPRALCVQCAKAAAPCTHLQVSRAEVMGKITGEIESLNLLGFSTISG